MRYLDSVTIIDPVINNYGDEKIGRAETVKCLINQATSFTRGNQQVQLDADMIAYLDPTDDFVLEVANRLEGMLVISNQYGDQQADSWFRITAVEVGEDKLLGNTIDHVRVDLKKTEAISYVS